ncbi:hypothetical protein ACYX37_03585 [Escherichia coli]
MKIFSVRQTVLPALLVLSPVVFAADEQTMIVSAAPQVVSETGYPSSRERGGWRGDAPGNTAH